MKELPGFWLNSFHFPPPPVSISSSSLNNPILNKLDDLVSKLSSLQGQLSNLEMKHDKFEQFMLSKNQSDKSFQESLDKISVEHDLLKNTISQVSVSIDHHENLFLKLIFPLFDDLCIFISQIMPSRNKPIDADVRSKFERYRILMNKAIDGNHLSV